MAILPSIQAHLADLPDPRIARTRRHELLDILTIALCAVIRGADSWVEVEQYGRARLVWLRTFPALPNGIPSHDTFGLVFARIDPVACDRRFLGQVQAVMTCMAGEVVALDGKVLRRSYDRGLANRRSPSSVPGPRPTDWCSVSSR